MNDLGLILIRMSRFDDAEPFIRRALRARRDTIPESEGTITSAVNFAGLLFNRGRPDEALELMLDAVSTARRILGAGHPVTLVALTNSGGMLVMAGRFDEAAPLLREAFTAYAAIYDVPHRQLLTTGIQYADALIKLDRYEEAVPIVQVLNEGASQLSERDPLRAELLFRCATVFYELGHFETARPLGLAAHVQTSNLHGPRHGKTLTAARVLRDLYRAWDAAEPGAGHDAEAARWAAIADEEKLDSP